MLFEHFLSMSYFSGTSISSKEVSQLTIAANLASLIWFWPHKDCQEAGDNGDNRDDGDNSDDGDKRDNGDNRDDGDKSVDGDDADNLGKSLTTNCP